MELTVGSFSISESEFRNLNIPITENTVRLSDEQGGGFDVGLEVFHQLHCLVWKLEIPRIKTSAAIGYSRKCIPTDSRPI